MVTQYFRVAQDLISGHIYFGETEINESTDTTLDRLLAAQRDGSKYIFGYKNHDAIYVR